MSNGLLPIRIFDQNPAEVEQKMKMVTRRVKEEVRGAEPLIDMLQVSTS